MDSFWTRKFRWLAKTAAFFIICITLSYSCGNVREVPIKSADTVYVKEKIVDTVIQVKTEKEYIEVVLPAKDTINKIETKFAESTAEIRDGKLKHTLKNKDTIKVKTEIKYVDRYVDRYKEVPVEVPVPYVPNWCWIVMAVSGAYFAFKLGRFLLK